MIHSITPIIITHNSASVIEECLKHMPSELPVILVDNASTDNTVQRAKAARPDITIITNPKNEGYGRAANIGIQKANTPYALVMNPDVILQDDTIEGMTHCAAQFPNAAVIAPIQKDSNGNPFTNSYNRNLFHRTSRNYFVMPDGPASAEYLSGACMLIQTRCFENKEIFDPNIFLFYEDDDICLRARALGYETIITPDAQVTHNPGTSSPPTPHAIRIKNWHLAWSRLYMQKKYRSCTSTITSTLGAILLHAFKTLAYTLCCHRMKRNTHAGRCTGSLGFLLGKKSN